VTGDHGPGELGSAGCLLLVGSYSNVAAGLSALTAEAAARVMMSPAAGDFTEVRFVDLGPRPARAQETAAAVTRIAYELVRPARRLARNYFALVVADRSAALTEATLLACAADRALAALPMRWRGLASIEDRQAGARAGGAADVRLPPGGSWSRGTLVEEVRAFACELLSEFAAGREPGLSAGRLDLLQPATDALYEPAAPGASAAGTAAPPAGALVFLVLAGGERADSRAAWRRGRSVLLEVDKKIAAAAPACQMRALPAAGIPAYRKPRPAGRLSRRGLRPPVLGADFARMLAAMRAMIGQDLTALDLAGQRAAARPAVVFYAADPPVADAVTAQEYGGLVAGAAVTWVVPERCAALMSPVFSGGGARILADYHAVADEVARALVRDQARDQARGPALVPSA
jgi:hypothetical protein